MPKTNHAALHALITARQVPFWRR